MFLADVQPCQAKEPIDSIEEIKVEKEVSASWVFRISADDRLLWIIYITLWSFLISPCEVWENEDCNLLLRMQYETGSWEYLS